MTNALRHELHRRFPPTALAALLVLLACPIPASGQSDASLRAVWWRSGESTKPAPDAPRWVREVHELLAVPAKRARAARPAAETASFRKQGLEAAWRATAFAAVTELVVTDCLDILSVGLARWKNGCRAAGDGLTRALQAVSGFAPAVAKLMDYAPYPEVWAAPADELRHVDIARSDSTVPDSVRRLMTRTATQLAVELESGDHVAARVDASSAFWTPGEAAWLRAAALGIADAGREALDMLEVAARADGGEHETWLTQDIAFAGDSLDLIAWKALAPGPDRAAWLRTFWTSRDEAAARQHGARWAEHMRRYRHVWTHYRAYPDGEALFRPVLHLNSLDEDGLLLDLNRLTNRYRDDGRSHRAVLDMRASIYMRHGEPSTRVKFPSVESLDNDAWLYNLPDAPMIAVFRREFGIMVAVPLAGGEYDAMCQIAAFYCVLAARNAIVEERDWGKVPPERINRLKEQGRYQYQRLETTDSYNQRFDKALPSALQIVGVSGPEPMILSAIEVATTKLPSSMTSIALRWQTYVTGADGRRVIEHDTVRSYTLGARGNTFVAGHPVAVPPGTYAVTTVVSTSDSVYGAAVRRAQVTVLGSAPTPAISDITLFSTSPRGLRGTIADEQVYLAPSLLVGAAGRTLGVGFVARNLAGAALRVAIAVRRQGAPDGAAPDIAVAYTDTPTAAWQWRPNEVSFAQLDPGGYDIELLVTLPSGEVIRRTHPLIVR